MCRKGGGGEETRPGRERVYAHMKSETPVALGLTEFINDVRGGGEGTGSKG